MEIYELRKTVLDACEQLQNHPAVSYFNGKNGGDYAKKSIKSQNILANKNFSVGVAACQSAGKSSVVNGVLGFPLMPVCNLPATCTVVRLKYGETIRIEIGLSDGRSKAISCNNLPPALFSKLLQYYCACFSVIGLENVRYFMDRPLKPETKTISPAELKMNPNDPRHVAALLLAVLSAYMKQNEDDKILMADQKDALDLRSKIFQDIGLLKKERNFTVTVYWNAPFLKNGLSISDLPGLGANVESGNGIESHEETTLKEINETQAMMYLLTPTMLKTGEKALEAMMNVSAIKDSAYSDDRVIGVINKMDQIAGGMTADAQMRDAKGFFIKRGVHPETMVPLAAIYGEYAYIENGINNIESTEFATKRLETDHFNDENSWKEELPRYSTLLQKAYENRSGIPEFRDFLCKYAARTVFMSTVAHINNVHRLLKKAEETLRNDIAIYTGAATGVSDLMRKLFLELTDGISNRLTDLQRILGAKLRDSIDHAWDEHDFKTVQTEFVSKISTEMMELQEELLKVKGKMSTSLVDDIVIYRVRQNEIRPNEPNYGLWNDMKKLIENTIFNKSFSYLSSESQKMIRKLKGILGEYDSFVEEEYRKMYSDIKNSLALLSEDGKTKLASQPEMLILLDSVLGQVFCGLDECQDAILRLLSSSSDIEALNNFIADKFAGAQANLQLAALKNLRDKLEGIKETGVLAKNSHLFRADLFTNKIKELFVLDQKLRDELYEKTNAHTYILGFLTDVRMEKQKAVQSPMSNFEGELKRLSKALKDGFDSRSGNTYGKSAELRDLLARLQADLKVTGQRIDTAIDNVKNETWAASQMQNLKGITFSSIGQSVNP